MLTYMTSITSSKQLQSKCRKLIISSLLGSTKWAGIAFCITLSIAKLTTSWTWQRPSQLCQPLYKSFEAFQRTFCPSKIRWQLLLQMRKSPGRRNVLQLFKAVSKLYRSLLATLRFEQELKQNQKMGYPNANMSIFLGPDIKIIRSLLSFFIEYLSRYEEKEKTSVREDLANVLSIRIQREFQRWKNEPWILLEFLERRRDVYLTDIHLRDGNFSTLKLVELGAVGSHSLMSNAAEYVKDAREKEMFDGRLNVSLRSEENVEQKVRLEQMRQCFRCTFEPEIISKPATSMWQRKRIAKERFAKKLSEENTIFSQKVILRHKKRLREKKKKPVVPEKSPEAPEVTEEEAVSEPAKAEEQEEQEEREEREETPFEAFQKKLENLKIEKEKEINETQEFLNELDQKKGELIEAEKALKAKQAELQRRKAELAGRNKELQDMAVRKHEITTTLDDTDKLQNLLKEEQVIETQLDDIKNSWEEIKQQMEQEIEKKRKMVSERKIEYTYKADQIKQMKKEINDSLREMKYKEELIKFMEEEYAKTPKDITRQFYVDKIAETINNVKGEKSQIDSTITDIKDLKEVISKTIESIHEAENEVEEVVFKVKYRKEYIIYQDAQKDKLAKNIYEKLMVLRDAYGGIISLIQQQNVYRTTILDIENKVYDIRQKLSNSDVTKLLADLNEVKADNDKLLAKLKELAGNNNKTQ
eukprot:TRINITY_DN2969_c0_g1_i1.p1 TRINITY_DN2969_c0_g1~~TRINITY_DN2969_c0_g1_i1.p1  ORF type:complete len:701 (-),score=113.81 TRINITY_DN2969_c0_g1_i1:1261-3363(-)